jgi:hypothetical protein
LAFSHAASDLDLDRFLGNAEANCDLPMGETVQFPQDGDFTAASGQSVDRFRQKPDLLSHDDIVRDTKSSI